MFDSQKAEAFASRLLSALNSGGFCLMASIGHRTGLFDAMRDAPPMTSTDIADRAGLNERYVREWLGAMVTAGVVDVDPSTLTFTLPPEHAAFLHPVHRPPRRRGGRDRRLLQDGRRRSLRAVSAVP